MTGSVLVLNAGYEELHTVSLKHAITMLERGVAQVEVAVDGAWFGPHQYPKVLRLVRYVTMRWLSRSAPKCTSAAVRARDHGRCAYCGGSATTVDHVVPRSRGGLNEWTNVVAACIRCNHRKADLTLAELGWVLSFTPAAPSSRPALFAPSMEVS